MLTPAIGLLRAGSASTTLELISPPQSFSWSFNKNNKRGNGATARRKNNNQLALSCRPEFIERKSRQDLVLDPGGCLGRLCGCLFLGGRCEFLCKGVGLGRHDGSRGWKSFWGEDSKEQKHQG